MTPQTLSIKTKLQIQKPSSVVFEAIADPNKMNNYFISYGSGRMEAGKTLTWRFPEFDFEFPVRVRDVKPNEFISFNWDSEDGKELLVEIKLESKGENDTLVIITEAEMENNEAGIKWLKSNTEGWANFLACLKAYLEYGINLRKGGFDYMKEPNK